MSSSETKISEWKSFFEELCTLIGYKFNTFQLNYYDGSPSVQNQRLNSQGWVNQITPFAILVLIDDQKDIMDDQKEKKIRI